MNEARVGALAHAGNRTALSRGIPSRAERPRFGGIASRKQRQFDQAESHGARAPRPRPESGRCSAGARGWIALALLGIALLAPLASAEVVHRERSLYQTILVVKQGRTLCLQFSLRQAQRNQSCLDERRPERMVLAYTRMMMAALLFGPAPQRILVVGVGGGTLPMALTQIYPTAQMDAVEIDPAVIKVAKRHFGFAASERLRVHVEDARVFTRRAVAAGRTYDLILLDAFGADYIPEHLMTREYLADTRALLTDNGALAANTFAISELYDHESATYFDVFGPFFNLKLPSSGNRVILATKGPLPSLMTLNARAAELARSLAPYGIRIRDYPRRLKSEIDWAQDTRVLTDQYAPANLLQAR